tara:strand:- start:418 stop:693 length:276 start_codon:yes stop_codon:yes gene_type:complete
VESNTADHPKSHAQCDHAQGDPQVCLGSERKPGARCDAESHQKGVNREGQAEDEGRECPFERGVGEDARDAVHRGVSNRRRFEVWLQLAQH